MERDAKRPIDGDKADESEGFDKEERQPLFSDAITQDLRHATGGRKRGEIPEKAKSPRHPSLQEMEGCAHPVRLDVGKALKKQEFEHPFRTYMLHGVTLESHKPWPGTSIRARLRILR